jgi:hypothetical protein
MYVARHTAEKAGAWLTGTSTPRVREFLGTNQNRTPGVSVRVVSPAAVPSSGVVP